MLGPSGYLYGYPVTCWAQAEWGWDTSLKVWVRVWAASHLSCR